MSSLRLVLVHVVWSSQGNVQNLKMKPWIAFFNTVSLLALQLGRSASTESQSANTAVVDCAECGSIDGAVPFDELVLNEDEAYIEPPPIAHASELAGDYPKWRRRRRRAVPGRRRGRRARRRSATDQAAKTTRAGQGESADEASLRTAKRSPIVWAIPFMVKAWSRRRRRPPPPPPPPRPPPAPQQPPVPPPIPVAHHQQQPNAQSFPGWPPMFG